ncbi:MAG: hypothetical protein ACLP6E_14510 [Acidimicrobiales bacterium]
MIALCRYIAADTARSLRWVPPLIVFSVFEGIFDASAGQVLPAYAASAALMFFLAIWLSVVVCTTESPVQEDITSVAIGSRGRVRIAKMVVAFAACLLLSALAVAIPTIVTGASTSFDDILAGLVAVSLTVLFGVALGALCSRPIFEQAAWAVLVGGLVGIADIVIPYGPPIRQLLVLLNETNPRHLLGLVLLIAIESAAMSLVIVVSSLRIMRNRA